MGPKQNKNKDIAKVRNLMWAIGGSGSPRRCYHDPPDTRAVSVPSTPDSTRGFGPVESLAHPGARVIGVRG
jgi:hypothetical protein